MNFHLHLNTDTVEHALATNPLCVEPDRQLRDVMSLMQEQNRGAVLICEQDKLIGIFTERDALRIMAAGTSLDVPIKQVMIKNPATLATTDSMSEAISRMSRGGYRRMPVVDTAGRPIGIVKVSRILHYLVEHFPAVVYTLPPAPHHSTSEREGA